MWDYIYIYIDSLIHIYIIIFFIFIYLYIYLFIYLFIVYKYIYMVLNMQKDGCIHELNYLCVFLFISAESISTSSLNDEHVGTRSWRSNSCNLTWWPSIQPFVPWRRLQNDRGSTTPNGNPEYLGLITHLLLLEGLPFGGAWNKSIRPCCAHREVHVTYGGCRKNLWRWWRCRRCRVMTPGWK